MTRRIPDFKVVAREGCVIETLKNPNPMWAYRHECKTHETFWYNFKSKEAYCKRIDYIGDDGK